MALRSLLLHAARGGAAFGALSMMALALLAGPALATTAVPTQAHALRITWDSPRHRSITVTNERKVGQIAKAVDSLPSEPPPFCSEGVNLGPPSITFAFVRTSKGRVLAQVSGLDETQFPFAACIPFRFRVHGHKVLWLEGGATLIQHAEKILGRRLH